jgi:hypothetical protein
MSWKRRMASTLVVLDHDDGFTVSKLLERAPRWLNT